MIVYIPTPITSVEQAEALPDGTLTHGRWPDRQYGYGLVEKVGGAWMPKVSIGNRRAPSDALLGWTALVPIEAEDETTRAEPFADGTIHVSPQYWRDEPSRRLVTRWITQDPTESAGEKVE